MNPSQKLAELGQSVWLPDELAADLQRVLKDWAAHEKVRRFWARDASLWTGSDESNWLGWLGIIEQQRAHLDDLKDLAAEVREAGLTHILLLGMGGSSLCPDVLKRSFGKVDGYPELTVVDSTDPQQIASAAEWVNLARTLFIVSSKSGSTLEPNILKQYFFERARAVVGEDAVGSRFLAVTDPGSALQKLAEADHFRWVYYGVPTIGGRYSALSNFGMVPAAAAGIDAAKLLGRADEMASACSARVPAEDNPGVVLGAILGVCGRSGRDKVTVIASPAIREFGAWLEQLLAESTGKNGTGLIPVDREEPGPPDVYGEDRIFLYLRLESEAEEAQDEAVSTLEKAGHPLVRVSLRDLYDLGREFFRWEMATAVAGSVLGVNPFDQPDVEASKVATGQLTSQYERTGKLPVEEPFFEQAGLRLFAQKTQAEELEKLVGPARSLSAFLRTHLARLQAKDYFALLAYLEMNSTVWEHLQEIRHAVRDRHHVATCLGFGPRFLHSTGQAYKGGPNTGVFLQITGDDPNDLAVPGQRYTFGVVKAAQARGDFQVLNERKRRALRVHLPADLEAGLQTLKQAFREALS